MKALVKDIDSWDVSNWQVAKNPKRNLSTKDIGKEMLLVHKEGRNYHFSLLLSHCITTRELEPNSKYYTKNIVIA